VRPGTLSPSKRIPSREAFDAISVSPTILTASFLPAAALEATV